MKKVALASVVILAIGALVTGFGLLPAGEVASSVSRSKQQRQTVPAEQQRAIPGYGSGYGSESQRIQWTPRSMASLEQMRERYVELTRRKSQQMDVEDLQAALSELDEFVWADEALTPLISDLLNVASQHPDSLAARKARMATYLLRLDDARAVHKVGEVLSQEWERTTEAPPARFGR